MLVYALNNTTTVHHSDMEKATSIYQPSRDIAVFTFPPCIPFSSELIIPSQDNNNNMVDICIMHVFERYLCSID